MTLIAFAPVASPLPPRCRAHLGRAATFAIIKSPSRYRPAVASTVIVGRYLRVVIRSGTWRPSRGGAAASASLFRDRTRPEEAAFASITATGRGRGCPPVSSAAGRRPPPPSSAMGRDLRVVVRGGTRRPSRGGTAASASLVRDGTRSPHGCPRRDAAAFTFRGETRRLRRLVHGATGATRRLRRLVRGATPIVLLAERRETHARAAASAV